MVTYVKLGSLQANATHSEAAAVAPAERLPEQEAAAHGHPSTGQPAVEIAGVRKSFGAVHALRGVDLRVMPGHVYGVLGPNGAGKTTLLRIVLGLVRPDGGSVTVLGGRPGHPETLKGIGALVESPAFVPYLSGRTNLKVLARARGLPNDEVARVLQVVDLTDRADERFAGYSLGMGQRLGVAAALLGSPGLLILDEPTNGLDPEGVASMRTFIRRIGEQGTTVLLSSHLLSEVQQICDRVIVINNGRVIADDTVSAVRARTGATVLKIWASPTDEAGPVLTEILDRSAPVGDDSDESMSSEDAATGSVPEAGAGADPTTPRVGAGSACPVRVEDQDQPYWRLETTPEIVPELVRGLVRAGIAVHEIRRERPSLEDVFFTLTRDDADPAPVANEGGRR
ncbi:ABC transporter ATP-binding protein [Phytoactinopolyspora halotolerans]|uniref:ABC transporter ATP-binding protein n=1 Tax=Phytoactinopolyspora halotolerans TaxID=1981512 RepID=A0A6L9SF72_9ACTN|nr:ABC transporter ATP-binding protein [Phytoactinopolyspora halotolerans]NEE03713.1 ABC transporter ATP-binding protein [Phytoactinopolyspora halotolerans]